MTKGRGIIQTPPEPAVRCHLADRRPFGRRYRYRVPAPGLESTEDLDPRDLRREQQRDRRRREPAKDNPLSTRLVIVIIFSGNM